MDAIKVLVLILLFGAVLARAASVPSSFKTNTGPFCKPGDYYKDMVFPVLEANGKLKQSKELKFQKIGDDTLKFAGSIDEGDAKKLEKFLSTGKIKRLIVNSSGGSASEGANMGSLLLKHKVEEVIVDGICASSCANYLFTAAPKKWIRFGIVGFHGNLTALYGSDWAETEKTIRAEAKNEKEANLKITNLQKKKEKSIANENAFFSSVGLKQELFDLTQQIDKGMGDGKVYQLVALGPGANEYFGITGVRGDQNLCFAETFGIKAVYWTAP